MTSEIIIIQMVRADVGKLLKENDFQIMGVLLHYKKHGKEIYEIMKEQCFITRWMEPRVFIGNYPYTEDKLVSIYVGRDNQDDVYFKFVDANDKKNV